MNVGNQTFKEYCSYSLFLREGSYLVKCLLLSFLKFYPKKFAYAGYTVFKLKTLILTGNKPNIMLIE